MVTVQIWAACPLMWLVQARHTPTPQPYFGPVIPSLSRSTHSNGMSAGASVVTAFPLSLKV
jgi:hypothetical protein